MARHQIFWQSECSEQGKRVHAIPARKYADIVDGRNSQLSGDNIHNRVSIGDRVVKLPGMERYRTTGDRGAYVFVRSLMVRDRCYRNDPVAFQDQL